MLTGLWIAPDQYKFTNPANGREVTLYIPRTDLLSKAEVDELIDWQREWAEKELGVAPSPALTRDQQHDLGATLMEIKASHQRQRETLHGRWR